ncbi:MAG: hypothetical protein Kapaf2KO_01840 [Candidatus Kapaibacteriales bacterium]
MDRLVIENINPSTYVNEVNDFLGIVDVKVSGEPVVIKLRGNESDTYIYNIKKLMKTEVDKSEDATEVDENTQFEVSKLESLDGKVFGGQKLRVRVQ